MQEEEDTESVLENISEQGENNEEEEEEENEHVVDVNSQFNDMIRWYNRLNYITDKVNRIPSDENITLILSNNRKITLTPNLIKYLRSLYSTGFSTLKKTCTNKKKSSRISTNDSLINPFYISDQLKNYIQHSNFGSGVAFGFVHMPGLTKTEKLSFMKSANSETYIKKHMTDFITSINQFELDFATKHSIAANIYTEENIAEYYDAKKQMKIILDENIIPGNLPIVILNMIIMINDLIMKSKRRMPSPEMNKYLDDKKYRLQYLYKGSIIEKDDSRDRNFFDVLRERSNKKGMPLYVSKESNPEDYGLLSNATMIYANFFRIPSELYTEEMKNRLKESMDIVKDTDNYIYRLREAYDMVNSEENIV